MENITVCDLKVAWLISINFHIPFSRLEEEKLAHRLARVCEPSQNTEDMMAAMHIPGESRCSSKSNVRLQAKLHYNNILYNYLRPPIYFDINLT